MNWIDIDKQGVVMAERVVAVGHADSAPIRRLVTAVPVEKCIILTGGRKREAVLVLDTGHLVITALSITEVTVLLRLAGQQSELTPNS